MSEKLVVSRGDGTRLAVQLRGEASAPTLLLLQGQASSHTWWDGLRERWEDTYRTVTLDYRGTGDTRAPDGPLTTDLLAEDAVAVLDALDLDQAHVYGTSMGGRVAQVLAGQHPSRVRSLVLACTSPGGEHAAERDNDVRRALASSDPDALARTMVELFYTPAWGYDPTRSNLFGDPTMTAADRQRHLRMSAAHDAWDLLANIDCPTLVMHGADDRMTPASNAEALARRIPGARTHIHPRGRHGFFDEFADDLHPTLRSFWS